MANRLMSAYGNLAGARTDIGRSLSDIAGIGIEMEYGKEGRIAGQMAQSRIQRQTEAIGLGLESVQKIAGMGVEAEKEAERASEVGGEEVYKTKTPEGKTGYTTEGSMWQKMGRYLGFSEREYDIGGSRYTSSQIETALPYHRAGKSWEDVSKLMGGGAPISAIKKEPVGSPGSSDKWGAKYKSRIDEDIFTYLGREEGSAIYEASYKPGEKLKMPYNMWSYQTEHAWDIID